MPKGHHQQASAFQKMWIGDSSNEVHSLGADQVALLLADHCIPEELAPGVQLVLEFATKAYWQETGRANIDYKACRKDLSKLASATSKLLSVIDHAAPDTFRVLQETSVAREFQNHSVDEIVGSSVQTVLSGASSNTIESEPSEASHLEHLHSQLTALRAEVEAALKWSRAGKSGRPEDDSATDLMQACFIIWTDMAKRDFTLAWYGNEADSDAARFCVDVGRVVDPALSASRIISASRKVRETGFRISDLDKIHDETDEFLKRMK